jgi:hypothetical protein
VIDLNSDNYRSRTYSQSGEEGIVRAFIDTVYADNKKNQLLVCEFGAHDGSNSNLIQMLEDGHSKGIFIECDSTRFDAFKKNFSGRSNISVIRAKVGWGKSDDLSAIFKSNGFEIGSLNILSIDIDGDDLHVFASLNADLDLLLIEYNPTFGFDTVFRNPKGRNIGSSPLALSLIAHEKGMFLAALTETNLIFVNNRFEDKVVRHDLNVVGPSAGAVRYAMGYDGTLVVADVSGTDLTDEVLGLGWSSNFFVQPLPKFLREFNRFRTCGLIYSVFALLVTRPLAVRPLLKKVYKVRKAK